MNREFYFLSHNIGVLFNDYFANISYLMARIIFEERMIKSMLWVNHFYSNHYKLSTIMSFFNRNFSIVCSRSQRCTQYIWNISSFWMILSYSLSINIHFLCTEWNKWPQCWEKRNWISNIIVTTVKWNLWHIFQKELT